MDARFSPEQEELRRAVRQVARDHCSPAQRRAAIESGTGEDEELWRVLAGELGVVGMAVREEYDGSGGSFLDTAVVLEEAGRALFPAPLLGCVVAACALERADRAAAAALTPPVARGEQGACLVVAPGATVRGDRLRAHAEHVLDAQRASVFVIAGPDGLWAMRRDEGVEVASEPSLDLTRWHSTVRIEDIPARRLGDAAASAAAVDVLRVALALEATGVARQCLETTTDYLKTRVQFGRPIGSFQALQHRAADLMVAVEAATSAAYYAAWAVAGSPAELGVVAPLALAVCGETAYRLAAETIQLHGGIGFTWEHDAHLYFKRVTAIGAILGGAAAQRRLVAERSGLTGDQRLGTAGPVTPQ